MTLEELKDALLAADPATVLVSPRLLTRIIREVRNLPNQVIKIPHRKSFIIDRRVLFRHVDQDDLDLDSDRLLPPTVILMARPAVEKRKYLEPAPTLLKYWAMLFHASVHLVLQEKMAEGHLQFGDVRARIEQIGLTQFEEIRTVLQQEGYLFSGADDREVYAEFAAVYLELRCFSTNLCPVYFPAIRDFERINQLLAQDVNADALFTRTRLAGAPDPVLRTDPRSDESHDDYWHLVRRAARLARSGNTVRAAILRTKAAGLAPVALTARTRAEALADLQQLTVRLQAALKLNDAEAQEWRKDLPALLEKASQGRWTVEARLLYDLQKVCVDHERDIFALDLVEWVLSAGKRPIKRPLPSQRIVRITKHLRSASQRLTMARLSDADRQHLGQLLQTALERSEQRLRGRFRPVLTDAFYDVGLQPSNPPEQTAFHKMVEELLDRIAAYGFLTFSDLRDVISRNNLKMPDIPDAQEFVRGDPLLRLDRRLTSSLDGVYRPSEFYLRLLERLTSLNFGTEWGRLFTRYVTVPFGGAFLILEGIEIIVSKCHEWHLFGGVHVPLFGPLSAFYSEPSAPVLAIGSWLLLGFFLLALMHFQGLRQGLKQAAVSTYRIGRELLIDMPARLLPLPALRRFLNSWPFQLFYGYLLKPLLVCAALWLWFPPPFATLLKAGLTFLAINLFLNSRLGHATTEFLTQAILHTFDALRSGLLEGLFRLILRVFKQIADTVEYVLYTVDEWLRFRSGESWLSLVARVLIGVVWFPVSYVVRLYVLVLIEPGFNPLKAPVSIAAAKVLYPLTNPQGVVDLVGLLAAPLEPLVGPVVAKAIAFPTWWLLPDAFGFLFWETKENWRLYRANRPDKLKPVVIGRHGEKMRQLLVPGFHSGTLPRLFRRLRRAEREAYKTGIWRTARTYRHSLTEVEKSLRQFVERELITLLHQRPSWHHQPLNVGKVALASQQIDIELCNADFPATSLRLVFAEQAGRVVASIEQAGWLPELPPPQFRELTTALAGLYKLGGVDLVREQIRANLPPEITAYNITRKGLVLRCDLRNGSEAVYDLDVPAESLQPYSATGRGGEGYPVLDAGQLIFAKVPLTWNCWVESWQPGRDSTDSVQFSRIVAGELAASLPDGPRPVADAVPAGLAGGPSAAEAEANSADHTATSTRAAPAPPGSSPGVSAAAEGSSPSEPSPQTPEVLKTSEV
jgi:hypothetical protein